MRIELAYMYQGMGEDHAVRQTAGLGGLGGRCVPPPGALPGFLVRSTQHRPRRTVRPSRPLGGERTVPPLLCTAPDATSNGESLSCVRCYLCEKRFTAHVVRSSRRVLCAALGDFVRKASLAAPRRACESESATNGGSKGGVATCIDAMHE
jgi:hypothetical protein